MGPLNQVLGGNPLSNLETYSMKINTQNAPTEFTSERLQLWRYRPGDIAMDYQVLCNNGEHLYEFMPSFLINVRGEENVKAWFAKQGAEWDTQNLLIFGAWERELLWICFGMDCFFQNGGIFKMEKSRCDE